MYEAQLLYYLFFSSSLSRKVLVLHTRDTVRLRKLSLPHNLRRWWCCATFCIELSTSMKLQFHMPRESVAKHCMAQMSYQTRAYKGPRSTLKSSPQDTHQVGSRRRHKSRRRSARCVDNEGRVGRETQEEDEEVVRART